MTALYFIRELCRLAKERHCLAVDFIPKQDGIALIFRRSERTSHESK